MGTITLVRHGQANSDATDDASYDRLSDLGHQQADWLGQWLRNRGEAFDVVLSGSLRRHRETSAGMGHASPVIDPRLNELDYFNLSSALQDRHGIPMPTGDGFLDHMPQVMEAWHRAEIMGQESFADFETRVTAVLGVAAQPGRNVLCITSGGVIGMVLRHILNLDPRRMAHILTPIYNSSIHQVQVTRVGNILSGFNAIPHLEGADRAHARTHF